MTKNKTKKNIEMGDLMKAFGKGASQKAQAIVGEGYKLHKAISMAVLNSKPKKK